MAAPRRDGTRHAELGEIRLEKAPGEEDAFASQVRARGETREFAVLEENTKALKSFDLLLFRGSDRVSDAINKLTTKHRGGVDFFSHVGICLAPPLLPREGHCMKRGECEATAKPLPFVQLRLQLRDATPSADPAMPHELSVTVLQCRGLPSRLDEGGTKEDPYVRVSLAPYDGGNARRAGPTCFRTKTVWHRGHNHSSGLSTATAPCFGFPLRRTRSRRSCASKSGTRIASHQMSW